MDLTFKRIIINLKFIRNTKDILNQINVNYRGVVLMTAFFKEKITKKTVDKNTGIIYSASLLGISPLPAFQAYPFAKSLMTYFAIKTNSAYRNDFGTMVVQIGQVLTNMNNPHRQEMEYTEVPKERLQSGFITAEECATSILKNYDGKLISSCHPKHEIMRVYWPIWAPFFHMIMLKTVKRKI